MDVLSPDLMWIDGRCYRVPLLDPTFSNADICTLKDWELEEEADDMFKCEEEDVNEIPDTEVLQNGRCRMIFPVARVFLPFIIGSKGATIKRISNDTSCIIKTPKFSEEQNITITGPSRNKVILAWKSIAFVIKSSRNKLAVTHFVSIPLNGKEIQENFKKFKEEVLSTCNNRGICEDIFQVPEKLHLTIAVLILTDEKERTVAKEKLIQVCNDHIRPMFDGIKSCTIKVRGLDYFNDDPSEVKVLYTRAEIKDHDNLLQDVCDRIYDSFKSTGFIKDKNESNVRIHLTLMNISFLWIRDSDSNTLDKGKRTDRMGSETFDASNIVKKYKDFYFGEQELKTIHLSIRSTVNEDGFYKHAAVFEL